MTTPPTKRLYYHDSWLMDFDAQVLGHGQWQGKPSVLLDQSAFYPESGGQMADRGMLRDRPVTDVQVDEQGLVHHLVEGELPPVGHKLSGKIDRVRRRIHMSLHTGQHMLSAALLREAGGETVSSRLGESLCSIDLDLGQANEAALQRAEDLTNSVIDDDLEVRAFFPSASEMESLPLRRRPKVDENIRVVSVGDFDFSPCGGTHCTRSGQVGLIRITHVERVKKKVRVVFTAGGRARHELFGMHTILRGLARDFTCGIGEVEEALAKVKRERKAATDALGVAQAKLAEGMIHALKERVQKENPLVAVLPDTDMLSLRKIVQSILLEESVIALASAGEGAQMVVVARGAKSPFDAGAFFKRLTQEVGGGGGGKSAMAQGKIPTDVDFESAVRGLF